MFGACHTKTSTTMRFRPASLVCAWALIAALAGCKKAENVMCDPPVSPTCPAVVPSFANEVYPKVFVPYCVSCHSSIGIESGRPLTTYQQIYGQGGSEAGEIFAQVFENCLMPPSNAPAQLTDTQSDGGDGGGDVDAGDGGAGGARQALLDWLVCGAPNN